jgi:hypothetical protein
MVSPAWHKDIHFHSPQPPPALEHCDPGSPAVAGEGEEAQEGLGGSVGGPLPSILGAAVPGHTSWVAPDRSLLSF